MACSENRSLHVGLPFPDSSQGGSQFSGIRRRPARLLSGDQKPDLIDSVVLGTSSNGRAVTEEDLDRWVENFPIEEPGPGIRLRQLPPV